jgi:hypothetical protein
MLDAIRGGRIKGGLESVLKQLRDWDFEPAIITNTGNDVGR